MNQLDVNTPERHNRPRVIEDFDQLAHLFSHWEGKFEQVSRGAFAGTIFVVNGRRLDARLVHCNQIVRVRGREKTDLISFHIVDSGASSCSWQGRQLDAGAIVVRGTQSEADHLSSKPVASRFISMSETLFRQAVIQEVGADPGPFSWQAVRPRPEVFAALANAHQTILKRSRELNDIDASMVEMECLHAAINVLYPINDCSTNANRIYRNALARRAEECMRGNLSTPWTEDDLCRALKVTGRTLRLAMKERFGMGPMAYLQTLRLNAAREALKHHGHEGQPVASIARAFGFNHLGKFANYYHRLFGEVPSATRRAGR